MIVQMGDAVQSLRHFFQFQRTILRILRARSEPIEVEHLLLVHVFVVHVVDEIAGRVVIVHGRVRVRLFVIHHWHRYQFAIVVGRGRERPHGRYLENHRLYRVYFFQKQNYGQYNKPIDRTLKLANMNYLEIF